MEELTILELFSGIGGMHSAFNYSKMRGKVVCAIDINPVANAVYQHNHPEIEVRNNNIQNITPKFVEQLGANMILMSPPCQPFTRVGLKKDVDDARTDALKHICDILPNLKNIKYILMENVKGFENSKAYNLYIETLRKCGFYYRDFILTPTNFGVPNTRHRFYNLARKDKDFEFNGNNIILDSIPNQCKDADRDFSIKDILEFPSASGDNEYLLSDELLRKRAWLLDIVSGDSKNSICFTKAYTHYVEGTGSVYSENPRENVESAFKKAQVLKERGENYLEVLKPLKLRYFTPREVARLMSFPEEFTFPDHTTNRQKYRLLGNSINVLVVGNLIKILCN